MADLTSKSVTTNFLWRFFERVGAQGVKLLVQLVLARLLAPSVFGTIAIITVFTSILEVFISSGFGNALIQKKDADDLDFSTVFYFNIFMCVTLYILLFFAAPFIADFYEDPQLTACVRVMGLMLIISGVKGVQQAYVAKNMMFKRFFFATLGGTIGAAVIGIYLAYNGFGVWALIAQNLFNHFTDTLILWLTVKWKPRLMFSFERLKGLFSYGWKLLVSSLIGTIYNELRSLIIGKKYSTSDLALYNRGYSFPNQIATIINSSIDSVLLPTMSKEQDDRTRVRAMTRRAIKTSTYLMMPIMTGLAVCAEPFIRLVLTEKWLPSILFLRIFCITFAFYPIHTANLNAIKAMGRSDLFLKLEIIKKAVGLAALAATMFISVEAMAYSLLGVSLFNQIVNSLPNKKLLGYSYRDQCKDMLPQMGIALLMGAIVYGVSLIDFSFLSEAGLNMLNIQADHALVSNIDDLIILLIQVPLGVALYIAFSKLFKIDSYAYLKDTIKSLFSRKKKSKNA